MYDQDGRMHVPRPATGLYGGTNFSFARTKHETHAQAIKRLGIRVGDKVEYMGESRTVRIIGDDQVFLIGINKSVNPWQIKLA